MKIKALKYLLSVLALAGFVTAMTPTHTVAGEDHKIVIHVDENDAARMNMALNNASNIDAYYKEKGEEVTIELVTYGPGLIMLIDGKSPVQDRIASFEQNFDNISFRACGNTHRKMSQKAGMDIKLVSQAKMVPSGVVHLSERQEQGWTYIRP
jgi:uncharacterized protein